MTGARRVAVYPGTFDPVTNGHLDLIGRARRLAGRLIVGVHRNAAKQPLFDLEERVAMLREEVARLEGPDFAIEVCPFDGLLIDFARDKGADLILRGLRAVSDFEYEFQMAGMNAQLNRQIETVFLMASDRHQFIASRLVKEISRMGGDVSGFVPDGVARRLVARLHPPGLRLAADSERPFADALDDARLALAEAESEEGVRQVVRCR